LRLQIGIFIQGPIGRFQTLLRESANFLILKIFFGSCDRLCSIAYAISAHEPRRFSKFENLHFLGVKSEIHQYDIDNIADIKLYNTSGILRADRRKRISSREPLTGIRKAKNTLLDTVGQNWRKDDATVKHISDKFYGLIFNCNRLLDYSFIIRIGTKIGNYE